MKIKAGYKQTEVGVIPCDWEVKLIKDYSLKITDGEHLTPIRSKIGYYLLSARNILNGKIDVSDVDYVASEEYHRIRQRCNPEYGDVLISCSGSIGRVATVPEDFECVMVRSAALIKPDYSKTTGLYIQYYLQSSVGQNQIFASMNQGAQPNLFLNHIQGLRLAIPPTIEEQTLIANALSDADALISSLEKLIAKKRNIKQGAMQGLLSESGFARLKDKQDKDLEDKILQSSNPENPDSDKWEVKKLGEVIGRVTTGKLDANAMRENGEYRFYTCAKDYYFIDDYAFDTEALLVSGNGANVGYIHYYKGKFNAYQRTYVLTGFDVDVFYIKLFLDSYLKDRITTEVSAGNTPYIKMDTITDMVIRYPKSKEEQTRIATILSDMDAEIAALETKLEKYKRIKLGMMQNLLTGNIRLV